MVDGVSVRIPSHFRFHLPCGFNGSPCPLLKSLLDVTFEYKLNTDARKVHLFLFFPTRSLFPVYMYFVLP